MTPKERRPIYGISLVLIAVAVALSVFLWLQKYAPQPAATRDEGSRICAAMPTAFATLTGPLTIDAYVTTANADTKKLESTLRDLLAQYQTAGRGRVATHVYAVDDDAAKKRAQDLGLHEQLLFAPTGSESDPKVAKGIAGATVTYGGHHAALDFNAAHPIGIDFWVTNMIRSLVMNEKKQSIRVGVISGHGEIGIDQKNILPSNAREQVTLQAIFAQNMPYYAFEKIDLPMQDGPIDERLTALLITQPERDFTDAELSRIDEFVMRGKGLAFFASAVNTHAGDPAITARLATHGLEKLAGGYGVELHGDLLYDPAASFHVPGANGEQLRYEFALELGTETKATTIDPTFPPLFALPRVGLPLASSLTLHGEKQPHATVKSVLFTSPDAIRSTAAETELDPSKPHEIRGEQGGGIVGAGVFGTLHSAFSDRESAAPARVFVVASADVLANPFARASNPPGGSPTSRAAELAPAYAERETTGAILLLKRTLDWLAPNDPFSACQSPLPL